MTDRWRPYHEYPWDKNSIFLDLVSQSLRLITKIEEKDYDIENKDTQNSLLLSVWCLEACRLLMSLSVSFQTFSQYSLLLSLLELTGRICKLLALLWVTNMRCSCMLLGGATSDFLSQFARQNCSWKLNDKTWLWFWWAWEIKLVLMAKFPPFCACINLFKWQSALLWPSEDGWK